MKAFTIDGTQFLITAGTYTVLQIVLLFNLNLNIAGLRQTTGSQLDFRGTVANVVIGGGEAFASTYGPF